MDFYTQVYIEEYSNTAETFIKTSENKMKKIGIAFLIGLLMSISSVYAASQTDDIRILIDVSGSMKLNDPNNLRKPALRMLNGLIPTGAKAGIWTFGRFVNTQVKPSKVNKAWRKKGDAGAAQIHSNGLFTNIESALTKATIGWKKKDKKTRRTIILLTDGQVDVSKNPAKNKISHQNIISKNLKKLKALGVRVHTIALSKSTDETLLKRIALETEGSFEVAETDKDLQRIFFKMFERATKPDTVPLIGNNFTVDKSIKEMTLLIFKDNDSKKSTQLFDPSGRIINKHKKYRDVSWRSEEGYDLVTVTKPKSGKWQLDAKKDGDNRVMVVTDLKLIAKAPPPYILPNQPLSIIAELQNKGKVIRKNNFLRFVKFKIEHIDQEGLSTKFSLPMSKHRSEKGQFPYLINEDLKEGEHVFVVSADSNTFKRSKRFSVEVQWPIKVEIIPKPKSPGFYSLIITPREEYIDPDTLDLKVILEKPSGEKEPIKMLKSGGTLVSTLDASSSNHVHVLQVSMQALSVSDTQLSYNLGAFPFIGVEKIDEIVKPEIIDESKSKIITEKSVEDIPKTIEEKPEEETDWMMVGIITVLVNVIIIGIGVGVFMYIRKKKIPDELSLDDDIEV